MSLMKLRKTFAAALAALTLTATAPLALADAHKGPITISHGWTRATPPSAPSGGGFIDITNAGPNDDRLIAVKSPVAGRVELHEMTMKDGVMTMREKAGGIPVPAGQTVSLAPGGLHIMFMKLNGPFKQGDMVPVTLTFEKAGDISMDLKVEKIGAKGMAGHDGMKMDHSKMDHSKMPKAN